MMFPRAMNNKEKEGLKIVKELKFSYELKFDNSLYSGGYIVNIPSIKETWSLKDVKHKK